MCFIMFIENVVHVYSSSSGLEFSKILKSLRLDLSRTIAFNLPLSLPPGPLPPPEVVAEPPPPLPGAGLAPCVACAVDAIPPSFSTEDSMSSKPQHEMCLLPTREVGWPCPPSVCSSFVIVSATGSGPRSFSFCSRWTVWTKVFKCPLKYIYRKIL